METYVVRIYRRDRRRRRSLVGVVEEVGVEGKRAFGTLEELWRILTARKRSSSKARKGDEAYSTPWSVSPDAPRKGHPRASRPGA